MNETVTIKVTQSDIDCGIKHNCKHCPVASALRRAFPGHRVDTLTRTTELVSYSEPQLRMTIPHPLEVQDWIIAFDNGDKMKPIDFEATPLKVY